VHLPQYNPGSEAFTDRNNRAPFCKARSHLKVFLKAITQSVQTFCDLFTGMGGQFLGACVHLDAGNDTRLNEDFDKGGSVALLLANGFVEEDCTANRRSQPWSGHYQFSISPPRFSSLRNSKLFETLVTGSVALIHREQALVIGK